MKRALLLLVCAGVAFCQCSGTAKMYTTGDLTACVSIDKREPGKDIPHNGVAGTLVSIVIWTKNEATEAFSIAVVHELGGASFSRSSEIPHPRRPFPTIDLPVSVLFWLPEGAAVKSVSVRENQPPFVIHIN